eukprot:TRINITY_DN8903_c0_g1_i1.p1 TRINITY_DN8903_c0_g1~~TRINITY_DN8903_c0_g1_i1.p1  ORF type:complete len:243 (+),score=25.89 TRINITY_DN8903_c0_g1_i1:1-729(+)
MKCLVVEIIAVNKSDSLFEHYKLQKPTDFILFDTSIVPAYKQLKSIRLFEVELSLQASVIIGIGNKVDKENEAFQDEILEIYQILIRPISKEQINGVLRENGIILAQDRKQQIAVFMIDDEPIVIKVHTYHISQTFGKIISAITCAEAFDLFSSNLGTDMIIIVDSILPDCSGHDLIRRIQEEERTNKKFRSYIISNSGSSIEAQREAYKGLIVDEYLTKPMSQSELMAALNRGVVHFTKKI